MNESIIENSEARSVVVEGKSYTANTLISNVDAWHIVIDLVGGNIWMKDIWQGSSLWNTRTARS